MSDAPNAPHSDARARNRFIVLNLVRLSGAVLVALGAANVGKRWIEPADAIGTALLLLGALGILVVPRLLARRWRSAA